MATNEAYMLSRDEEETKRLDAQHLFMRHLARGALVQPHVPLDEGIQTIADVGTGTGIWLREAIQELGGRPGKPLEFVGFDISSAQFPNDGIEGADLVVHDITKPFPAEYREKFDLVHIRFLSYALKAQDLEAAVTHVIDILRPGGYLQWQEIDVIDSWADPQTPNSRSTVSYIISERVARGLTRAITTPLLKTLQMVSRPLSAGQVSPIGWSGDAVRVLHVDTFSTMNHQSPVVQAAKRQGIKSTAIQLLQPALMRRLEVTTQPDTLAKEAEIHSKEIEDLRQLLKAWDEGTDPACNEWNFVMTSIVARKAFIMDEQDAWMVAKY